MHSFWWGFGLGVLVGAILDYIASTFYVHHALSEAEKVIDEAEKIVEDARREVAKSIAAFKGEVNKL